MWKYHKNAEALATLYSDSNVAVLDVFEGRDGYYSIPRYTFITSFKTSYSDVHSISEISDGETNKQSNEKILNAVCCLIEENYKSQVSKIREIIG